MAGKNEMENFTKSKPAAREAVLQKGVVVMLLALVCAMLWGSAFPCIKIGYELFRVASGDAAGQILFAGIRFTLAGILAILFASGQAKHILLPKPKSLHMILLLALAQTICQYLFFYLGLAHTTAVKGSILNPASNFFAILIAVFLFRQERFSVRKIIGCIVGFAGVLLINLGGLSGLGGFQFNGEGFLLISAISSGFSTVLIRIFSQKENPVVLSGWQFFFGGID